MSTKRDRLLRALASLASEHDASDWDHAATQLEAIASLARELGKVPGLGQKRMAKKKGGSKNKLPQPAKAHGSVNHTKETLDLIQFLEARKVRPSVSTLRELAAMLGLKSELPKTTNKILENVYLYIDGLESEARSMRVNKAIHFLEIQSGSQSDQYDRWVSLIMRKPGDI